MDTTDLLTPCQYTQARVKKDAKRGPIVIRLAYEFQSVWVPVVI